VHNTLIEYAFQEGSFRNTTVKGQITGHELHLGVRKISRTAILSTRIQPDTRLLHKSKQATCGCMPAPTFRSC
jgi:hypothetical protein